MTLLETIPAEKLKFLTDYRKRHDAMVRAARKAVRDLMRSNSYDDARKVADELEHAIDKCEAGS